MKGEKAKRPQIKFSNIVTVKQDIFLKKDKNVLFGIELPKDEELFSSESEEEVCFLIVLGRRRIIVISWGNWGTANVRNRAIGWEKA